VHCETGIGAEFVIAAVDSFMNRRPGGEDISVVMTNNEQLDLPRAGKTYSYDLHSTGTFIKGGNRDRMHHVLCAIHRVWRGCGGGCKLGCFCASCL
jgi:hypothetical protein